MMYVLYVYDKVAIINGIRRLTLRILYIVQYFMYCNN